MDWVVGNDMEKRKMNIKKRAALAVACVILALSPMCGCGDGAAKSVDSERAKVSADGTEYEKSVRRTVQLNLSDEDEEDTVLDLGADSVFGGIEVETDENGELVYSDQGSSIWYKITDSRFGTYSKFSRFARKSIGSAKADQFMNEADAYFTTNNGSLYFVVGAGGRAVSSTKIYVMNGGSTIRINCTHTSECRKKYGITRSSADFVKSNGTWTLDSIRNS